MELRHLRYFVAVAELENVSRAALKLHVSQPALSRQIRDLEEELGFPLLERSARSIRLTDAGRVFLKEARGVLAGAESAVGRAREAAFGSGGELHIAYAPALTARMLPPALRAFQMASAKTRVKLHDLSTEEMLAGLHAGKVHLAITVRPRPAALRGLRFEPLSREPLVLAVAPTHRFASQRSVQLTEALKEPFIAYSRVDYPDYHELLERLFAPTRLRPTIGQEHDGVSSLISSVEAGTGVAIVPQSTSCVAGNRVKLIGLLPRPAPIAVGGIVQKTASGGVLAFLECLRGVNSPAITA